jgi:hypothetical protein
MKNIKDITLSIFAIIGFVTILSSFNNQSQDPHTTPESHAWEVRMSGDRLVNNILFNKVTGEVKTISVSGKKFVIPTLKN